MSADGSRLVDLVGLTHVYRPGRPDQVVALRDLHLHVAAGEQVALVGPSGSGKTTLMGILAGLQRPGGGRARVGGRDLGRLGGRERDDYRRELVGYVWQAAERGLWPGLNALENVEAPMLDRPAAPEERRARAERLLRTLGLGHRLRHRPAELAAADRQRLAVAVALANEPALLLADEPADELDRRTAQDLLGELGALLREHGTTAVMASRDAGLGRFVDRTVELWAPDGGA